MGIQRIRRNGNDAFLAAVRVKLQALVVRALQQFVVDALGWHEHQREVEGVLRRKNIFSGDGVGVQFHRGDKGAASFVAVSLNAAESFQWEFGIYGQNLFIPKKNCRVHAFAAGETVLRDILRRRKRIFEQALERDLAQDAARFRSAQDRFERLLSAGEPATDFLKFSELFVDSFHHALGAFQLFAHRGLALRGNLGGLNHAIG